MNDWIPATARAFAERHVAECEESELGLPIPLSLLQIPVQYAEDDEPLHTDGSPICDDPECPCQPYDKRIAPGLEVSGLAVCCECGATCSVYEVIIGHAEGSETPCEHSWFAYQEIGNGQYILE